MTVLQKIIQLFFGRKYYAVVVNRIGTFDEEIASFVFKNMDEVEKYKRELQLNSTYRYVETISFWSKRDY